MREVRWKLAEGFLKRNHKRRDSWLIRNNLLISSNWLIRKEESKGKDSRSLEKQKWNKKRNWKSKEMARVDWLAVESSQVWLDEFAFKYSGQIGFFIPFSL